MNKIKIAFAKLLAKSISSSIIQRRWSQVVVGAASLCLFGAGRADAATYYVSPGGNNTDGLSYKTAWTELSKIPTSAFVTGNTIYIDGGPSGITYKTVLNVVPQGATGYGSNLLISPSPDQGHNGTVTIDGTGTSAYSGVIVSGAQHTVIDGTKQHIIVQNFRGSGVQVRDAAAFLDFPSFHGH
jgi:hypothetical protein